MSKFIEVIWVVETGIYYESGGAMALYSSYEEAYKYVKSRTTDHDSHNNWNEVKEDGHVHIDNGDAYYEVSSMELEGKTKYAKRLEAALLYNFPDGDIEKILESIEQSIKPKSN